MQKIVIIGVIFLSLAGCNKSSDEVAEVAATGEGKLDLKGMYPGMSKDAIEAIVGKMNCMPSVKVFENIETNVVQAEKNIAQNIYAAHPPSDALNAAKKNDEQLVQIRSSGRIEIMRVMYKEQLDTYCIITKDGGLTYANYPTTVAIGLRSDKARSIALDVIGASSNNLLDALIVKYKWMDGTQNGLEQAALRMQRNMSLAQGIVDERNNILSMLRSPDEPNATRMFMTDAKFQKAVVDAQIKVQEKQTGATDA